MLRQTEAEKFEIIRQAILSRRQIVAMYRGCRREMCPHLLGRKHGNPQALFYQFGGESNSRPIQPDGRAANWRCMFIEELSDVSVRDGDWHTAPNHSQPSSCVDRDDIVAEVSY